MKVDCSENPEVIKMIVLASETLDFVLNNRDDLELLSCVSFDYMMGFGYLVGGWLMHKSKAKANTKLSLNSKNESFLKSKVISGEFYNLHILPRVYTHFEIVKKGAKVVQLTDDSYV